MPVRRKIKDRPLFLADAAPLEWSDIEAADDSERKLKKFSMVAYTGGLLNLSYWAYPVVLDLAGLKVSGRGRPILKDHQASLIIGHTTNVEKTTDRVTAEGVISGAGPVAREVAQSAANGFPWQASVGARPEKVMFVAEGKSARANGQTWEGPIYIVRKAKLGEISFVAMGADDRTSAKVAASAARKKEESEMKFAEWLEAKGFVLDDLSENQEKSLHAVYDAEVEAPVDKAVDDDAVDKAVDKAADDEGDTVDPAAELRASAAAESRRIAAIHKLTAKHPDIEAKAIEGGWNETKVELEVLKADRPNAPAVHAHEPVEATPDVMSCAICAAGNLPDLDKRFNVKVLEAAQKRFRRQISLQEILLEAAWANGYTGRTFRSGEIRPIMRAAFSTLSLPGILSNTANKFLLAGFNAVDSIWREIASRRNVSDFKQITSYRLTGAFQYEQVGPDGELKHATIDEESFTNQAETYGIMYAITRQDQINDDLGALTAIPQRIGRGGAIQLNDVFWTAFLDNSTFFTTARKNYASGGATALDSEALATAVQMFREQTDPSGKPLALTPRTMLVPPALEAVADELYASRNIVAGGGSTKNRQPSANVHAGKYEPRTSPYLSNDGYTGYSNTAWYLLGDPAELPVIEVAFLNGQETPTVESADADFNVLGIQMRGYHDFGVSKQEYRGGLKMAGV